jgi:hypothetical protein
MKYSHMILALALALGSPTLKAALNIPSDGSDGALVVTTNTVIDLARAVTGNWDANNTANAGKGVYDPAKWAVVFKYSNVRIQAGATVTFKNHPSRAPVVWLVTGDVTIAGKLVLDGQNGQVAPALAEPGPGGFRGGNGYISSTYQNAPGFGPGGGKTDYNANNATGSPSGGGSYGSMGINGSNTYGNATLIPLLGGSGGGGHNNGYGNNHTGGGGGGAILIASGSTFSVTGTISSNGGGGGGIAGAGGSGGGIRLVCDTLAGTGIVQALGGSSY